MQLRLSLWPIHTQSCKPYRWNQFVQNFSTLNGKVGKKKLLYSDPTRSYQLNNFGNGKAHILIACNFAMFHA